MACPSGEIVTTTACGYFQFSRFSKYTYLSYSGTLHGNRGFVHVLFVELNALKLTENLGKKSLPLNLIMIALSFIFSRLSERRWSDKAWGRRNFKGVNK